MSKKKSAAVAYGWIVLLLLIVLTYLPVVIMLLMSFRNNGQIFLHFWALPAPWLWHNYTLAFNTIFQNIANSLLVSSIATIGVVILSSLSGFVFARIRFWGKEPLYLVVLSLIMVPGILTLIPLYVQISQFGLLNSWWALILPWITGGQIFGIILCRTFIAAIPNELFECARMDGASELTNFVRLALPLSIPILITLTIMNLIGDYNDFIWPLLVINENSSQVVTVALKRLTSGNGFVYEQFGIEMAGYTLASLPFILIFSLGMRYYVSGVTSGAVKG